MKKNEIIEVTCEYLGTDGKGLCKYNKCTVFVPFLLKGERAKVIITDVKGNNIYANIKEILEKSENRCSERCSSYYRCGSCNLRHLTYDEELKFKQNNVYLAYKNDGIKVKVEPTVKMDDPSNYRYKVIASFGLKKNDIVYGLYEEGTHNIIGNNDCPIQSHELNEVLKSIKKTMIKLHMVPFNEYNNRGSLRHVLLRMGRKTNEIMVVFVTVSEMFHGRNELVKELIKIHPNIKTIVQNINPRRTSVVLGDKERVLYGDGYIFDDLLGIKFKISPKSFFQVNPIQTEVLYQEALNCAELSKNDIVLDAYCGTGTISLAASKNAKMVYGVEIVKDAISDAISNAKENNIRNAFFKCDDAKKYMQTFDKKIDCLIVDPPRKGCDKEFINAVLKLEPKKIIYVSCDPFTQARDVKLLMEKYNIRLVKPVDMFPRTLHVETVCLLDMKK